VSFKPYPKYKESGVEWLGLVPEHWEVRHLKRLCHVFPSNVDKKSVEGEAPVLLCNYTDVYYNDRIVDGMDFMAATATDDQIAKFTLRAGDTIITKDSETADDIAVAAYVPKDMPGVICGYHLSMVRPQEGIHGAYVKRLFDSVYAKSCFAVRANGLTRVGLSQYEIDNVEMPSPPEGEQALIATFLDHETAKIDALISEQQRLIELLQEKRQAVISHAVTKGLNPDAPMKDSGIEWLGEVPEHWETQPVRHACVIDNTLRTPIDQQTRSDIEGEYPYYGPTGVLSWIDKFVVEGDYFLLGEDGDHFLKYRTQPMTVNVHGRFNVNNHAHLIRGQGRCSTDWASLFFEHKDLLPWLIKQGVGRYKLRKETLVTIPVAVPPPDEQDRILAETRRIKQVTTGLIAEANQAVALLQERRSALISAAVTGQIDVRGFADEGAAA
jgi:type I restriction enzyme S subunit